MDKPTNNKQTRSTVSRNISDLSQASSTTNGGSSNDQDQKPKRLPPIKAPVGIAKSPDLKNCKSKIGSLNNIKHKPAGGSVTIQTQKLNWEAKSKVGSLENKEHKPSGGKLRVESRKLEWKATSKVQSLQNVNHKPGGGNVKIFNDTYREKPSTTSSAQSTASNNISNEDNATKNLANDMKKIALI